jgi:hypothetical protein
VTETSSGIKVLINIKSYTFVVFDGLNPNYIYIYIERERALLMLSWYKTHNERIIIVVYLSLSSC